MIREESIGESLSFFKKQIKLLELEDDIINYFYLRKHSSHSVAKYLITRIGLDKLKVTDERRNDLRENKEYEFLKILRKKLEEEKLKIIENFTNVVTNSYNKTDYKEFYKQLLLKDLHDLTRIHIENWFDKNRENIYTDLFNEACELINNALEVLMKEIHAHPVNLEGIKAKYISDKDSPMHSYMPFERERPIAVSTDSSC